MATREVRVSDPVARFYGHRFSIRQRPSYEEFAERKILGCIPQTIKGDCGCICRPLSCINYFINPTVFFAAVFIIWSFVIWCAVDTEHAPEILGETQGFVVKYFGWFYIAALILFAGFCMFLVFSKYGSIKLGPEGEPSKYSLMTWFSMLFSAGIGSGLWFFGVAEPVWHFVSMQNGDSRWYDKTMSQQAMESLNIAWFHWGFTASATYCIAALPLAYHHHVVGRPLTESNCFTALIGEKYVQGIIGCIIDLASVISTMFGTATSLGLGVKSINAGLYYTLGIEQNLSNNLIIIWIVTGFATISVLSGLDHGIRRLSELNFGFSFIVLLFLFFALDPIYLIELFIQGIGYHFNYLLDLTFNTQAFEVAGFYDKQESTESQVTWMSSWTIFYWAWWIAWAPFVGTFIAQISRGRTIREFIVGNMIVPTLLTCIWLTIFGGVGLYNELGSVQNGVECSTDPSEWYSEFNGHKIVKLSCFAEAQDMMFATFSIFPLSGAVSVLAVIGVVTYFVTSSDSASHVIDILTAGGNTEPPKLQRIFWALSEGAVAAVLLAAANGETSSLGALQTASLVAALPFTVVLIFEVMSMYKTLLIHTGELKPDEQVYWKYDLFESGQKFPIIIFALLCPPYFQTRARLKIMKHATNVNNNKDSSEEMGQFLQESGYESNASKYFYIIGYWLFWALCITFLLLEFVFTGFIPMSFAMYCFYFVLCIMNRLAIKEYYGIDSSHIIFDACSWAFCCCCAAVQEDLQSDETIRFNQISPLEVNDGIDDKKKFKIETPRGHKEKVVPAVVPAEDSDTQ